MLVLALTVQGNPARDSNVSVDTKSTERRQLGPDYLLLILFSLRLRQLKHNTNTYNARINNAP